MSAALDSTVIGCNCGVIAVRPIPQCNCYASASTRQIHHGWQPRKPLACEGA